MNLAKITRLARHRYHQTIGDSVSFPDIVPMACYLCEQHYKQVCEDELTFYEHWALLALFGEMCKNKPFKIIFVPILPEDYFLWLEKNGFQNSPQIRSRYVTAIPSGTNDGLSSQIDDKFTG